MKKRVVEIPAAELLDQYVECGALRMPFQIEAFVGDAFGWMPISTHFTREEAEAALAK